MLAYHGGRCRREIDEELDASEVVLGDARELSCLVIRCQQAVDVVIRQCWAILVAHASMGVEGGC